MSTVSISSSTWRRSLRIKPKAVRSDARGLSVVGKGAPQLSSGILGHARLRGWPGRQFIKQIAVFLLLITSTATALANAAADCAQNQDRELAIRACTAIILGKEKGNKAKAFESRGVSRLMKRDFEGAMSDFNSLIQLNPRSYNGYLSRGVTLVIIGDYDRAIVSYNELIRLEPKNEKGYFLRALAWESKEEYDLAITDYSEAIRLNPKDAVVYNSRGIAWESKGQYDRAIADYKEAIRLDPNLTSAYHDRSRAELKRLKP